MYDAISENAAQADFIFMAAAVADYTPTECADNKIKKKDGDMAIPLKRTQDILGFLGAHRAPGQILCGFSMETQNMLENSRAKLDKKHVDMICANNLKVPGAGFGVDTNIASFVTAQGVRELPMMTKRELADKILDEYVSGKNS